MGLGVILSLLSTAKKLKNIWTTGEKRQAGQKRAIKWADFSPLRTRRGSARISGGPLADPPGVLFARTLADLLRTPPMFAADPKIRHGFAADPLQVCGGAVD